MIERIKKDYSESSPFTLLSPVDGKIASLPFNIKLNSLVNYYTKKDSQTTTINTTKSSYNLSVLEGNIGNNNPEFSLSFYGGEKEYSDQTGFSNTNISELYAAMQDEVMEINNSFISKNFIVIESPDYSAQSMTLKNYDMLIKIFYKDNGVEYKLNNLNVALLKSYTKKLCWILIDKDSLAINTTLADIKIIIDFVYKTFPNNIYSGINSSTNLQDYFNSLNYKSIYYDIYTIDKASATITNSLLNKQDKYFKYENDILNTNYSVNDYKDNFNYSANIVRKISKTNIEEIYKTFDTLYVYTKSEAEKYLDSLDFEVYKYELSNNNYTKGMRILFSNTIEESRNCLYEIFPISNQYIHYIIKVNSQPTNIASLKSELLYYGYFMSNSDFKIYNSFKSYYNSSISDFIDLFIPLVVDGKSHFDESVSAENNSILDIDTTLYFKNSYTSKYEPSNRNRNMADDSIEYVIPYNGNDKYISSILEDGNPRIVDYSETKLDPLLVREAKTPFRFDILTKNSETDNTIIVKTYFNNFKSKGIKNYNSTDSNFIKVKTLFKNYNESYLNLCMNLSKLLDDSVYTKTFNKQIIKTSNDLTDGIQCYGYMCILLKTKDIIKTTEVQFKEQDDSKKFITYYEELPYFKTTNGYNYYMIPVLNASLSNAIVYLDSNTEYLCID